MDIESRLRKLESRYRAALSAAVAARSHYLALAAEASALPAAIERAEAQWKGLEALKKSVVVQMDELERQEHDTA
jgi:hypothetical protein